jgi:RND superfamily putative drug exporter
MRLSTLARFCYRRRRLVLVLWLLGTVLAVFAGFRYGAPYSNDFSSDSATQRFFDTHFPQRQGDSLTLAIHADRAVGDPDVRARLRPVLAELARVPHVIAVASPYEAPGQISPDGRTAFATAQLDGNSQAIPTGDVKTVIADVRAASGHGLTLALGGAAVDSAESPPGGRSGGIGILAAAVVLLISFGSLLATGLPLLTAVLGIGVGLALLELLGHLLPAPAFAPIVAGMMGLGVGVDYALFIVTRYRDALAQGEEPEAAVVTAITVAGRAVLFAGSTVVIAMLGLLLMRQPLLNGVAVGAAAAVLMTMIAAVTLLPALLGFTGLRIDRFRLPWFGRATSRPLAERWARAVQRRPLLAALGAGALLLALAAPVFAMRLSMPDSSVQARDTSGYASHRILADGFGPGYDAPFVIGVAPQGAAGPVHDQVRALPGIASVTPVRPAADGQAAEFVAYPTTALQDAATFDLVDRLRAIHGVQVAGPTAGTVDFAALVTSRLPLLIAVVVAFSLVLLLVVFRSVTIAIKAAVMNLLSAGAAYGVLVAVVQWGWGHSLFGLPTTMPIAAYVPMMMFPILFGLSMDYEVFLISRVREEYDRGLPTADAVTKGLARTARVITAAAAIMIVVFLSFVLGADVAVKQLGLGLAVAVLIDATVVRLILVPALMELLGAANWWMPRLLHRLLPTPAARTGNVTQQPQRLVP